ncbi:MAG TPA: hypothetical protein VGM87_21400 [Roseomonas sp.]|jgi:TPR repeat protein
MRRRAFALLALLLTAQAPAPDAAGPLHPDARAPLAGPGSATGALVWLHPAYDGDGPPPEAPPWSHRLTTTGWDLWRFDRAGARDPLDAGADALAAGVAALHERGYARVIVLGESRGAFIALTALRQPLGAEAVLLVAPAAHGTSPERRPEALAAFTAALRAARPEAAHRLGLVLFRGDPYDPDPDARATAFREAAVRLGLPRLLIDRPEAPEGHAGQEDPAFDAQFGDCMAAFATGVAARCPG